MNAIEQEIKHKDRFTFVADWVVKMTGRKDNREMVSNYQVRRRNNKYQIWFEGFDAGYGWMTAEEINSWFVRLPLNYFAMEAEQMIIAVNYSA